jgi:hypothetical protein
MMKRIEKIMQLGTIPKGWSIEDLVGHRLEEFPVLHHLGGVGDARDDKWRTQGEKERGQMKQASAEMQLTIGSTKRGRKMVNSYGGMKNFMESYGIRAFEVGAFEEALQPNEQPNAIYGPLKYWVLEIEIYVRRYQREPSLGELASRW